ncbi:MAG: hypothetical protein CVU60_12200 [Deltaproteobacteria bacterium HGW-Deltaproteobacteria-18]|nr:MAG: hypothetical protein CVU60_12200 [Deltaproteobacteria bacterium HGW-Deltaproteobacteria-18]
MAGRHFFSGLQVLIFPAVSDHSSHASQIFSRKKRVRKMRLLLTLLASRTQERSEKRIQG